MKKILTSIFFFFVTVVCTIRSYAQTGWAWAIANDATNTIIESGAGAVDSFGNVYTSYVLEGFTATIGSTTLIDTPSLDLLAVTKVSPAGTFLWTVGTKYANTLSWDITSDAVGNLYVCGVYDGDSIRVGSVTLLSPGSVPMFYLAKIAPSGTVLWAQNVCKTVDYYGSYASDLGVQIDGAGNAYVTGMFDKPNVTIGATILHNASSSGTTDIFIAKYDSLGGFIWAKSFGGTDYDYPGVMAVTKKGNIYFSGTYNSSTVIGGTTVIGSTTLSDSMIFLSKFDSSGSFLWAENLNQPLVINGMVTDSTEQLYMTGLLNTSTILGLDTLNVSTLTAFFVARYSASGSVIWGRTAAGTGVGYGISIDQCRHIWLSGSITDTLNFSGATLIAPAGSDPLFIASCDTAGNYITNAAIGSGGDDYNGVLTDNNGNLYIVGDFEMDPFIVGPDTLSNPYPGTEYLFIAKYNYDTIGCSPCPAGAPVPDFTISGTDPVTFTYTGTALYDSLRWDFGDSGTSTATDPVHTYTASGSYTVCVDVYSGCVTEGTYTQYCSSVIITDSLTRINNTSNKQTLAFFPNPASTQLTLTSTDNITNIIITNIVGQLVYTHDYNTSQVQVDVSKLASGVYFIKVNMGADGVMVTKKFVKE